MKYRILEVEGKFTPQYSGELHVFVQDGITYDSFYSFIDLNQKPISFDRISDARLFLNKEAEFERIRNLPPIIHEYP